MVPATVMRQVFLGSSRDYMVEVADGTQMRVVASAGREYPAGLVGLAAPAAGALPRAGWMRADSVKQTGSQGGSRR